MAVTNVELAGVVATIPATSGQNVKSQIDTYMTYIKEYLAGTVTHITDLENISVTKSTPKNGIMTFDFTDAFGITVTISYRL